MKKILLAFGISFYCLSALAVTSTLYLKSERDCTPAMCDDLSPVVIPTKKCCPKRKIISSDGKSFTTILSQCPKNAPVRLFNGACASCSMIYNYVENPKECKKCPNAELVIQPISPLEVYFCQDKYFLEEHEALFY